MSTTDFMEHDGAANGHGALANGAAAPVGPLRRPLSQAALRRVARVVVQLAGRAQYSKARPLGCAKHIIHVEHGSIAERGLWVG